ncbi:Leucine Rich Repeat [Seminavis robusta]|uniref:Leucine Rich Repeat n=1 Tax=Seminavis robusta TaxID=568900 RepID=A0A9N8EX63_9STRA|nr:Leucine Rich Repeat [Seminavis robusta]|eukprot:Sro1817_g299560.1 Leucine Rich Repeat (590) ;mRNA; r:19302-21071
MEQQQTDDDDGQGDGSIGKSSKKNSACIKDGHNIKEDCEVDAEEDQAEEAKRKDRDGNDVTIDKAKQTLDSSLLDDIASAVQPLPRRTRRREPDGPGAYCIQHPAPLRGLPTSGPAPLQSEDNQSDQENNDVILGAEVVTEEEQDLETGSCPAPGATDNEMEVYDAQILPDRKKRHNANQQRDSKKCVGILVVLGMLAVVAVVLIPVFLLRSDSSTRTSGSHNSENVKGNNVSTSHNSSSAAEDHSVQVHVFTEQPVPTLYPPFQDSLPVAIQKEIEDPSSPFYLANLWMLQDPNLHNYSEERQKQRFYMAILYYATNGDSWLQKDGWMSYNVSECQWFSFSSLSSDSIYYVPNTCNSNGTLVSLSLANNNLTGTWPLFPTTLLSEIQVFDVGNNHIVGTVPPLISNPHLEVIIMSNNNFAGPLTAGDGLFDFKFKVVMTNGNRITSGVPNREGLLLQILQHSLEVLNSTDNLFRGEMPTELGLCTKLAYLGRGDTLIPGNLPSELGLLSETLRHVEVSGSAAMNGTLPTELGALTQLTHLGIAETAITGRIPAELCNRMWEGSLVIDANCSMVECCSWNTECCYMQNT